MTAVTFTPAGWKTYGAHAYTVTVDGEPVTTLMKTQHPGNAFEGPVRFWTLVNDGGLPGLKIYPADWPTLAAAKRAIMEHVAEAVL